MPDKHSHMNKGVDPELIRQYLAGELDNKAMHALERQAMDDPFLAEALEGFSGYKPDQRMNLADLNRRLDLRIKDKEEDKKGAGIIILDKRWMAAAGILLVAGVGLLWIWQAGKSDIHAIAQRSENVADSSITDTLQFNYKQEEPVAWGNATAEKPLAITIPSDTGPLAGRRSNGMFAEKQLADLAQPDADTLRIAAATLAAPSAPAPMMERTDSVIDKGYYRNEPVAAAEAPTPEKNYMANFVSRPKARVRLLQGQVKDNNGSLPGATVHVEGTPQGAITDAEGRFELKLADTVKDVNLVASSLGFIPKRMNVRSKENNVDIVLEENTSSLNDVIVTGYSKAKKASFYHAPLPEGGYDKFREYLAKNTHYPASAAANNIQGKVKVTFRVTPDGTIEDLKVSRRLQPDCDAEALRVVKDGPKWTPASDGRTTRVQVEVPFAP